MSSIHWDQEKIKLSIFEKIKELYCVQNFLRQIGYSSGQIDSMIPNPASMAYLFHLDSYREEENNLVVHGGMKPLLIGPDLENPPPDEIPPSIMIYFNATLDLQQNYNLYHVKEFGWHGGKLNG